MVTLTIAGGGVALASIPSASTAKFSGCVARQGGALRVIDAQAGKKCTSSEKKITWSKGWTHRGAWASGTTYKPGDVVTQSGSSYVARKRSTGVAPGSDASTHHLGDLRDHPVDRLSCAAWRPVDPVVRGAPVVPSGADVGDSPRARQMVHKILCGGARQ